MTNKVVNSYIIWTIIFWLSIGIIPDLMTFIEIPKPTEGPPWYFILIDLRESIGAVMGITLSLILLMVYYRKIDSTSAFLIYISLVWYGHDIGNGISILLNTNHVFNMDLAATNWVTQEQYLGSVWKSYGFYLYLLALSFLFFYINKRKKVTNGTDSMTEQ